MIKSSERSWSRLAWAALAAGLLCAAAVQAAAAPPPDQSVVVAKRAKAEYDKGHFDQAAQLYFEAWQASPSNLVLLFSAATCAQEGRQFDLAIKHYTAFLNTQPGPELQDRVLRAKAGLAICQRARADELEAQGLDAENKKEPALAAGFYRSAYVLQPDRIALLYRAGRQLESAGVVDEALKIYEELLRVAPSESPERLAARVRVDAASKARAEAAAAARQEAERKATEERARAEDAERSAAEQEAAVAERAAASQKGSTPESIAKAREDALRARAERKKREQAEREHLEAQRRDAERRAAEEALRRDAEAKAAQERAAQLAREEAAQAAARKQQEQRVAEEQARLDNERVQQAARANAEQQHKQAEAKDAASQEAARATKAAKEQVERERKAAAIEARQRALDEAERKAEEAKTAKAAAAERAAADKAAKDQAARERRQAESEARAQLKADAAAKAAEVKVAREAARKALVEKAAADKLAKESAKLTAQQRELEDRARKLEERRKKTGKAAPVVSTADPPVLPPDKADPPPSPVAEPAALSVPVEHETPNEPSEQPAVHLAYSVGVGAFPAQIVNLRTGLQWERWGVSLRALVGVNSDWLGTSFAGALGAAGVDATLVWGPRNRSAVGVVGGAYKDFDEVGGCLHLAHEVRLSTADSGFLRRLAVFVDGLVGFPTTASIGVSFVNP